MTDTVPPDALVWERLRAPFPADAVLTKPKFKRGAPVGFCAECQKTHGLPAFHLSYVGHADVTDRLLSVDPLWNWEPMALTTEGFPQFDVHEGSAVGLWIKLTVCGLTRIGYGSVEMGAFEAEKQLIGDAIRNAAMRFGVALDLWKKHREDDGEDVAGTAPTRGATGSARPVAQPAGQSSSPPHPPRMDPVVEEDRMAREVAAAFGGTPVPRGGDPKPLFGHKIRSMPITIGVSWDEIKAQDLGGRGQWARHTWEKLIEDPEGAKYLDEYLIPKAEELHMKIPGKALSWFYQKALVAWEEMDNRRGADATFNPEQLEAEAEPDLRDSEVRD